MCLEWSAEHHARRPDVRRSATMEQRSEWRTRRVRHAARIASRRMRPRMLTIDAQVHAYQRSHPGRPWVDVLQGPPEVTGDQMVAAMDAVRVDGAILVSP